MEGKKLSDSEIVGLYFSRDERAIAETKERFSAYCRKAASGMLRDERDAEECLNDVWLAAWESIPPQKPQDLAGYLGMLTRRAAIDRLRHDARERRGGLAEALEEFEETLPARENVEETVGKNELARSISSFLRSLPERTRTAFLRRYFYGDDIASIARAQGVSKSAVKMTLLRTREKLRDFLRKEGYEP